MIFMKESLRYFKPDIVTVNATAERLFPVPEPGAVGTLDALTNSIAFIKLDSGEETEVKVIAKGFSKMVYGGFDYKFSPNFSESMIAYIKTGTVVICDIKTGEAFHAGFNVSPDDCLGGISFLDTQNNLFAIVKSVDYGGDWLRDSLHIAKLEGRALADLGSVMELGLSRPSSRLPSDSAWTVHGRKLIVYRKDEDDNGAGDMHCFDGLNEASHPFMEVFNGNKGDIKKVRDFKLHPELPFGVVIEYGRDDPPPDVPGAGYVHGFHLLRWDTDEPKERRKYLSRMLTPLFQHMDIRIRDGSYSAMALAYPGFSPDGKWFVMGCFESNLFSRPSFIAVPVGREYSDFLGMAKPAILGKVEGITSFAWAAPATLAVSGGQKVFKWDLGELDDDGGIIAGNEDYWDDGDEEGGYDYDDDQYR